jgi:hypothetical protein
MASDPQFDETYQPEPPPKRGMSTGMKVLIILLCVFGGFALLCCGGGVYMAYKFKNAFSEDPVVVKDVTKKIADIDIPASFHPVGTMNINMFFMKMRFVVYETKAKTGMMMLMEVSAPNASEEDLRRSLNQQGQGQNVRDLQVKKTETKTFTIRGQKAEFTFSEAVEPKSKAAYRQVKGSFPGRDKGAVMLMLQVPEKEYNEAAVVKMINSIK